MARGDVTDVEWELVDHARAADPRVNVLRGVEVWCDGVPVEVLAYAGVPR
jgi:hypothetical protein